MADDVVLLNPLTCGIYKDGGPRFKINPATGERTTEPDNEMADHVRDHLAGKPVPGLVRVPLPTVYEKRVLVPRYFDERWNEPFRELCRKQGWRSVSLGELVDAKVILVRRGHGSPSNDKRSGHIPYVKVSDIRSLRVNTNPTNLVTEAVARQYWRGPSSGLQAWDVVTPNRASSNIGEFALLLPGEEQVVLTKEVFVIRVIGGEASGWSPFYLLWALSLKAVRMQWQRIALMQTNREDCGKRYREILIPKHEDKATADARCSAFRDYFTTLASAKAQFVAALTTSGIEYIASALALVPTSEEDETVAADASDTDQGDPNGDEEPDTTPKKNARRKVAVA